MQLLFDFDDILIEPVDISEISSRKEINPYYNNNLPLMTAPMDTVIDENNSLIYHYHGIINVLPRYIQSDSNLGQFVSYGLDEFIEKYINQKIKIESKDYVLIDVANGHMNKLYDAAKSAKKYYQDNLVLMIGNVASPDTFNIYSQIDVDYVRLGIGNGNGCLTTVQTGIGYPMASLITECVSSKNMGDKTTKIVADGGFKKYSDIIKALALGADYVMIGSIFNKALESAGETRTSDGEIIDQYSEKAKQMFNAEIPLYKTFRGMSTKEVQKKWGKEKLTTSEGIVKKQQVEYTLEKWVQNFEDYLRSAMSYCGAKKLDQFIGQVHYNLITQNSFNRYNK